MPKVWHNFRLYVACLNDAEDTLLAPAEGRPAWQPLSSRLQVTTGSHVLLCEALLVPLAGIEPALLAELDFESSVLCYNPLIYLLYFSIVMCMCKRLCKKYLILTRI
jgi:hypothetical protein